MDLHQFVMILSSLLQYFILLSLKNLYGFPKVYANNSYANETLVFTKKLNCQDVNTKLKSLRKDLLNCSQLMTSRKYSYYISENYHAFREHEIIFYEITSKSFSESIFLQLKQHNNFLSPNFYLEERFGERSMNTRQEDSLSECFYEGNMVNDRSSLASLNICNGLQGMIQNDTHGFIITPFGSADSGTHLLSQKITGNNLKQSPTSEGVTEDSIKMCQTSNLQNGRRIFHDYQFRFQGNKLELINKERRRMRKAISRKHFLETMVAADDSLYEHYGRNEKEIQKYLLSIMAIVTTLLKDGSIGNYLHLTVVKLVILKKNPSDLNITGDASSSLKQFCRWQKRQNMMDDSDPEHYDTAILLTKRNLCSVSGECETLGLAEMGSICDPERSCSVVEDNGLSVAFTIAHEIGHLLNAHHDGEQNDCTANKGKVHIMTPTFSIDYKKWTWSSCSRKYITGFLDSSDASCMRDTPAPPRFAHMLKMKMPGELFTRDEQCKLVYGKQSSHCQFANQCDRIWCKWKRNSRTSCHTNNMPWADGTTCGDNKWCIQGRCKIRESLKPINGGWGGWSSYSSCSRPCGGGVKYALRECNNPKPLYGGEYCTGARHKYKSCNTKSCASSVSFRAMQCSEFNGKNLQIPLDGHVTWLPKYTSAVEDSCKLFCEISGYGIFYQLAAKAIDGTKCRKDSHNICVDGNCMLAGCDNILGSNARVDQCGVCKGDNSSCKIYSGMKRSTHRGYNFVVYVPEGASRLKVTQMSITQHDNNFLALLNKRKQRYIFNGKRRISLGRRRYYFYGTPVFYSGPNEQNETIWIPGPLKAPLEVRVLSIDPSDDSRIRYSYTFPVDPQRKYEWKLRKQWSECFPVCKGYQIQEYECQRIFDSKVVSPSKCPVNKPSARHRLCNPHCDLIWRTKTKKCKPLFVCGRGIQQRESFCTKVFNASNKQKERVLPHFHCEKAGIYEPPEKEFVCFTSCVNARWVYSEWTKCTKTCGKGTRSRKKICMDGKSNATLSNHLCKQSEIESLLQVCNTKPCPQWHVGIWSNECSAACGEGLVERKVTCIDGNRTVDDSFCDRQTMPNRTRLCKIKECATWKIKKWSKCSKSCGVGYKTGQLICQSTSGNSLHTSQCEKNERPKARRRCYTRCLASSSVQQAAAYNYVYRWYKGPWGECSKSCGYGHRRRRVSCMSQSTVVSNRQCNSSEKPVESEICNTITCPSWKYGAWGKCSQSCGNGTQERHIYCTFGRRILREGVCEKEEKKQTVRYCNQHDCPVQQEERTVWKTYKWSQCNESCLKRRMVTCMRGTQKVTDAFCKHLNKPPSHVTCRNERCELTPVFSWRLGDWSLCSATCGSNSYQSRSVECVNERNITVKDELCKDKVPSMVQRCYVPTSCDFQWQTGNWSKCSKTCGGGESLRNAYCVDGSNNKVAEINCKKKVQKPALFKICNTNTCPFYSCREIQQSLNVNRDGEYRLQVGNRNISVYCEGMHRNNPKEFITLQSDLRENYSEIYGERLRNNRRCPNRGKRQVPCVNCIDYSASGVTFFRKIRIDIKRMTIIPEDTSFADRFGRNPPGYASAGDCYSRARCPQGRFMVNLRKTGIKIDEFVTWTSRGYHSSQKIRKINNGEVVYGKCGGFCGMCSPTNRNGLRFQLQGNSVDS